ncbi:hypothetical protein [Cypionkella sp.]|nr:hypothetical protein [Cypionkella sp.]
MDFDSPPFRGAEAQGRCCLVMNELAGLFDHPPSFLVEKVSQLG